MTNPPARCAWVTADLLYLDYHDREWGVPVHDDRLLFEFLVLETFQAGLSWLTVLRKRDAFRRSFDDFDASAVAAYGDEKVASLLLDPGIIRNRRKILAAVANARAFLAVRAERGTFDAYFWGFVGGAPLRNDWARAEEVPAYTPLAEELSRDLKRRDFALVGPTVVYALMQATGLVNDHLSGCFRHAEVGRFT